VCGLETYVVNHARLLGGNCHAPGSESKSAARREWLLLFAALEGQWCYTLSVLFFSKVNRQPSNVPKKKENDFTHSPA
jgi:hypothetical protein